MRPEVFNLGQKEKFKLGLQVLHRFPYQFIVTEAEISLLKLVPTSACCSIQNNDYGRNGKPVNTSD